MTMTRPETSTAEAAPDPGATEPGLPRVQLGLNVGDVEAAVDFYTKLFGVPPHKQRPGYANFAITSPPLKLVLFEDADAPGTLNHLGVEVADIPGVDAARARIDEAGLSSTDDGGVCCFAEQNKVWVNDPDGTGWEYYTITDDNPVIATLESGDSTCCA
jgi:catechol 2,3-dioxygenase-like lactoylglutathione lyase family enzyme